MAIYSSANYVNLTQPTVSLCFLLSSLKAKVMVHSKLQYLIILVAIAAVVSFETTANFSEYGVDISYPIHHYIDEKGLKTNNKIALGLSRNKFIVLLMYSFPLFQKAI